MDKSPRAEAFALLESGEIPQAPPMPNIDRDSPEAVAFTSELKIPQYVSIALSVDKMFEHMQSERSQREPYGLSQAKTQHPGAWRQFSADFEETFRQSIDAIRDTDEYRSADEFTKLTSHLLSNRHHSFGEQLKSGSKTAVISIAGLLQNLPAIARHHANDLADSEVEEIARNSTQLIRPLAKTCMNRMFVGQKIMIDDLSTSTAAWNLDPVATDINPKFFKLQKTDQGKSLVIDGFQEIPAPKSFYPRPFDRMVEKGTKISEIPCSRKITIGCPITLLNGRLAELWGWSVDIVAQKELWQSAGASS